MILLLKIGGLALALLGLLLTLLDLLGKFRDRERAELSKFIEEDRDGIPRSARGFRGFLETFPPPEGVDPDNITHIVKDVIQTHDRHPVSIIIRYLADNARTQPVATFPDVKTWAATTRYKWWALGVGFLGWVTVAFAVAVEALST